VWTTWWTIWWTKPLPLGRSGGLGLPPSTRPRAPGSASSVGGTPESCGIQRETGPRFGMPVDRRMAGTVWRDEHTVRTREAVPSGSDGVDPSPDVVEFIRFCYGRRRVSWPEIYDDMCAVASRGSFRGWGFADLARNGIGFTIPELPRLAELVDRIVQAERHPARAESDAETSLSLAAGVG
jgi:hypothetical protein